MNVSQRIIEAFEKAGVAHTILVHDPVYTSEQAATVRGVELKSGVKALVCKSEKSYLLVLVPANERADLELIGKMEGSKIKLASPKEVLEVTGCEIGSVPPFGHKTMLKTYFCRRILENEFVNFNIGEHTESATVKAKDLEKLIAEPLFF